jgi:hypothetical protein
MAAGALLELTACHPRHDGAPVEAARRTTARLPLLRRRKRATTAASIGLRRAPTPRQVFRERRAHMNVRWSSRTGHAAIGREACLDRSGRPELQSAIDQISADVGIGSACLSGADTGGDYYLLEISLAPGMPAPRHTHTREDSGALGRREFKRLGTWQVKARSTASQRRIFGRPPPRTDVSRTPPWLLAP